jgi:hypothetical protein
MAVFGVIIVQAMATAGFTSDEMSFTIPATSGSSGTGSYDIKIGGMSRSLDILNDPSAVGADIYYIWIEIFTM